MEQHLPNLKSLEGVGDMNRLVIAFCFAIFLIFLFQPPFFRFVYAQENGSYGILIKTYFKDDYRQMLISVKKPNYEGVKLSEVTITKNDTEILKLQCNQCSLITTPWFKVIKGEPYLIKVKTVNGIVITNVFYSSEHVIESLPLDCWLGNEYNENYNEYLSVFETAYNKLIEIIGYEIAEKGVTMNRVPWSAAWAGDGFFVYGISKDFHELVIKNKLYLPGRSAVYNDPEYGEVVIDTKLVLDTRFHELAHVVVDPYPSYLEESFACFFEIELFRLLGYEEEYVTAAGDNIDRYITYVGDDYEKTAPYIKGELGWPGPWIGAYIIEDFIGYGEYEDRILDYISSLGYTEYPEFVNDMGWDFLTKYFNYLRTVEHPDEYNDDQILHYYFSLAADRDLSSVFEIWGFETILPDVYSFVKGMDNGIYFNSYWTPSPSWKGWERLARGATASGIAAIRHEGKIYLVVRGLNNRLYYGELEEDTGRFTGWVHLGGVTLSKPAITIDKSLGYMWIVVRGMDNGIYIKKRILSTGIWTNWIKLPGATSEAPATAALNGKLFIAVKGASDNSIWFGVYFEEVDNFGGWVKVSGATPSAPDLAIDHSGYVYLAVRGMDNKIYYNQFNGVNWLGWKRIPTGSTIQGPAILFDDENNFHIMVISSSGDGSIYHCYKDVATGTWTPWSKLSGKTPSEPELT